MKTKLLTLIVISALFSSCWIEPHYGDYKIEGDIYYYEDFETMCTLLPPVINKKFTNWHWVKKTLNSKYYEYLNNTVLDESLYNKLLDTNYNFIVKTGVSNKQVKYYNSKHQLKEIKNTYFLIISRNKDTVVFFEE